MHSGLSKEHQRIREKGISRLEAFSDGIFAIAITLLALDLKIPAVESIDSSTLASILWSNWPSYISFILSFSTILIIWVYHHRLIQLVKRPETILLFVNGILLLFVSAVPFPTSLLGDYMDTPAAPLACAIYAGFFMMIDTAHTLLWFVIAKQRPLEKNLRRSMFFSLMGIPCYLIALFAAFWQIWFSIAIFGVLWVVWIFTAPKLWQTFRDDS